MEKRKHINDWRDLNLLRSKPAIGLIKNRIKIKSDNTLVTAWKNLKSTGVYSILIEVTNRCKNNCDFCLNKNSSSSIFKLDDLNNVLIALKAKGLLSVWLSGGEPLHDFERFRDICNIITKQKIDIEKISTSYVTDKATEIEFIELVNDIGKKNSLFKCTISIGINSFLQNNSCPQVFYEKIQTLICKSNPEYINIHLPILRNHSTSGLSGDLSSNLVNTYSNISCSFKDIIPNKDEGSTLMSINTVKLKEYMDCITPSLFPCTWPMWQIRANGEMYCCSSWFNATASKNHLGCISDSALEIEYSDYMKYLISCGSWYKGFIQFCGKNPAFIDSIKIPAFDDNNQKCFICREMMNYFK